MALVRTEVLEEHIASIIRVTRIGELGTMLAVNSKRNMLRKIWCEKGNVRMGHKSEGRGRQATGMSFGGNVKFPDYKGGFHRFGGRGLLTVRRARIKDSVAAASPTGPGSCPKGF
jgi:hypothetical protein